ncbi:MAG: hypothetical protein LC662_14170, partial [Rhodothermaceae bacterium]|nr:hypothetical protein [Rhodothermaceae bacterium]
PARQAGTGDASQTNDTNIIGNADTTGGPAATNDDNRTTAHTTHRQTVRQSQGVFMRFVNRNVYFYQWLMASVSDRGQAYYAYDRQFYSEDDPAFVAALDRIAMIREMAELNGIRFDLVMMPYEYQYRAGGFHPQDVLLNALQSKGIRAYDARAAFEGVSDITVMYMYGDGIHFSEQGHQLIWQWLRSEYLHPR